MTRLCLRGKGPAGGLWPSDQPAASLNRAWKAFQDVLPEYFGIFTWSLFTYVQPHITFGRPACTSLPLGTPQAEPGFSGAGYRLRVPSPFITIAVPPLLLEAAVGLSLSYFRNGDFGVLHHLRHCRGEGVHRNAPAYSNA